MYILIGNNRLKSDLEESLNNRDIDSMSLDVFTPSKLNETLGNMKNNIDAVILLYPKKEEIDDIVEIVQDDNVKTIALIDSLDEDIKNKKIDILIEKEKSIEKIILKEIENLQFRKKSKELYDTLSEDHQNISIFIHNNPDPDAIASAMALEEICDPLNLESTTYYGGLIGHPENEVFINNTGFIMRNIEKGQVQDIIDRSDLTVFLDFAEASVNNIVPERFSPDIIIDHHYTNRRITGKVYTQIRTDIGATSTLMTKHLQNLDIDIDPLLASALLYGIKVDTHDYTKNISTSDFKVISYLTALADKELLDIFESPPMKSETLSALGRAINNRDIEDDVLTAFAGHISYKDDIPQIAELLMRERDIMTVLVFGILDEKIHMSARSKDMSKNIGKIMKDAFFDIGSAGGHRHSAGGEISLNEYDSEEEAKIDITRRFRSEMSQK